MRRAVVIFVEDKKRLLLQAACLYTSLKHIQSEDTELVIFGPKEALEKLPMDCIKVESEPASDPPEFLNYRVINSVTCLADEKANFLDDYDYILRTDCDTFLTPAWNSFYPERYTAGRGGYVNDNTVRSNLKRVAAKLNLRHQGHHNLGSTHYGQSALVRDVCKLATDVTAYLLTEEFKDDRGKWPSWFGGVSLLYGCEIAVNHLVDDISTEKVFDFGSSSSEAIGNHPHLHCWHSPHMFSKNRFAAGHYDHLSTEGLDLNIIKDYCLYIALKSKELYPIKV